MSKARFLITIDRILLKKARESRINISNASEMGIRRMLNEPYAHDYEEDKPISAEQVVEKQKIVVGKLQEMIQDLENKLEGRQK